MTPEKLMELAKEAMTHAYVPYSGYKVGAALLCADGTVYQGCNMENAAYSPTVCAERTAFFKAVYDGCRDFTAIAVCGGKDGVLTGYIIIGDVNRAGIYTSLVREKTSLDTINMDMLKKNPSLAMFFPEIRRKKLGGVI